VPLNVVTEPAESLPHSTKRCWASSTEFLCAWSAKAALPAVGGCGGSVEGGGGVVGGVLVGGAGCPLLCPLLCLLLVGSGEASVLGAFSFHLFLLFSTDGILEEC
jgi:hypothetical protein